jgi:zinc protease
LAVAPAPAAPPADPWAGARLLEPPAAPSARPIPLASVQRLTLPNGLPVLLVPSAGVPVVDVSLTIRVGGLDETAEQQGLTALVGQLLRRQARAADRLEGVGGTLTVAWGEEAITIHCGGPATALEICAEAVARLALHPALGPRELAEVRGVLAAAVDKIHDDRDALAEQHMAALLFGEQHARGVATTRESIEAQTAKQLTALVGRAFVAQNAELAIAGPVEPARLRGTLVRVFGALPRGRRASRPEPAIPERHGLTALLVNRPEPGPARVALGRAGVRHRDPDYLATLLVTQVLRERLARHLPGLRVELDASEWTGELRVSALVAPEQAVAAAAEMRAELSRLAQAGPNDEEVDHARRQLAGSYALRLATPVQLMAALVTADLHGLPPAEVGRYPVAVSAVTTDEAHRAAARHLDPQGCVLVLVGRAPIIGPDLAKAGLSAELIEASAPISPGVRHRLLAAKSAIVNASAPEVGRARALIETALRASGGADRIRGIHDITVRSRMTVTLGGSSQQMTVTQYSLPPDKHRMDTSAGGAEIKMVVTAERAWQEANGRIENLPPPVAARARKEQTQRGTVPQAVLVRAADPDTKLRARGQEDRGGRTFDVIELVDRDGETTTLWLDAATHLLARIGDRDSAAELDDWRDVGAGLRYPFKIRVRGQRSMDLEAEDVKVNAGLSEALFR